jgi:hypothetical protein
MHIILSLLHPITAAIRMAPGWIFHYGPGVLGKYTAACAGLIGLLCLCGSGYDLVRGRRLDAVLWVGMAGLLLIGFRMEMTLAGERSERFALGAGAIALWLLGRAVFQWFGQGKSRMA